MYKYLNFLFYTFMFSFLVIDVSAKVYDCEYQFSDTDKKWTIEYDTEKGTYKNKSEQEGSVGMVSYVYNYDYHFSDGEILSYDSQSEEGKNFCPILYVIYHNNSTGGMIIENYELYSDSYLATNLDSECYANKDDVCLKNIFGSFSYFYTLSISDSSVNKDNEEDSICPFYGILMDEIKSNYKLYSECVESNCIKYVSTANSIVEKIRLTCSAVFKYRDVLIETEKDELINDACVYKCLNFHSELNENKEKYGISIQKNNTCGLSGNLIIWIGNIIKWGKYLVPVIAIVLGILDFIKAIGTDKDDEIKKAQGKFIKRLIAAALIFIVPFIIEFILDMMEFDRYIDGCGIIDL